MSVLKSPWTPKILGTFMFIGVVVELGAIWERDYLTHAMAGGLVLVSAASIAMISAYRHFTKKGESNAQAE
jgi:hypothetical protein